MQVGDLVELTWKLGEHLGASMSVGIITHIEDISREGIHTSNIVVTAVFGNWQTTQLEEYFRIINAPSR